jgi:hypothetical protein
MKPPPTFMEKPRSHKTAKIPIMVYNRMKPPGGMSQVQSYSQSKRNVRSVVLTRLIKSAQKESGNLDAIANKEGENYKSFCGWTL